MGKRSLILVIMAVCMLQGCKGTWLMYDLDQPDHIYFSESKQTHLMSFAMIPEDEIVVTAKVFLMGNPSGRQRSFTVECLPAKDGETIETGGVSYPVVTARENVDFTVGELVLPAGAVETTMDITLHRTPEMLEDKLFKVTIHICDDANFKAAAVDSTREREIITPFFEVYVTDGEPACPSWWRASGGPIGWHWDFGRFYPDKYRRFMEYFHSTRDTNPTFYEYCVDAYGYWLDTPNPDAQAQSASDIMNTFWRKAYSSAWAKYVFVPLYNYYKAWYTLHPDDPNAEPMGPGTINQGNKSGWSDPMDPGYGFFN